MKVTTNYNLKKPDKSDLVSIEDLNSNMDKIDTELKKANDEIENKPEIVVTDASPTERKANTFYYIITKRQGNIGSSDIRVGQNLSAKII